MIAGTYKVSVLAADSIGAAAVVSIVVLVTRETKTGPIGSAVHFPIRLNGPYSAMRDWGGVFAHPISEHFALLRMKMISSAHPETLHHEGLWRVSWQHLLTTYRMFFACCRNRLLTNILIHG